MLTTHTKQKPLSGSSSPRGQAAKQLRGSGAMIQLQGAAVVCAGLVFAGGASRSVEEAAEEKS